MKTLSSLALFVTLVLQLAVANDCKTSINCFIEAAQKCAQAQVFVEIEGKNEDILYKIKKQLVIQGPEKNNCVYQELNQNVSYELPFSKKQELQKKGWAEDIIKGQLDSTARSLDLIQGLVYECVFSNLEIEKIVTENFIKKNHDLTFYKSCKRNQLSLKNDLRLKEKKITVVSEDEEDNEEDDDYGIVPEYLEFPKQVNFIRVLKNYLAEISPWLGKVIPAKATYWEKSRTPHERPVEINETAEQAQDPMLVLRQQQLPPEMQIKIQGVTREKDLRIMNTKSIFEKKLDYPESERKKILLYGYPPPKGKTRLSAELSYEELVKRKLSNEQIGEYALKNIRERAAALAKQESCSGSCPYGLSCHPQYKKCVQCTVAEHCPGSDICYNFKCVPNTTVINP